ncbi:DUF1360 domain-containing protein [Lentzea cavernae]|uniref:DUF1360 domain-containing protein n=1 Tax=Lentzea cavernae TaxID=2020703 RepID=A0ABQ3MMD3_9PSEU|nr:DUF1360 domain-containing protein [Lentzea cavernae]GHH53590.1 hypothetical protein GCM10017774_67160 [Lentzea cavernae]
MKRIWQAYGEGRPLPGYLLAIASYTALVGAVSVAGRLTGVRLPDRFSLADTALVAVATHKASRLLTKEAVTSPLRAPFTRYEEPAGHAEIKESVRSGHPAQHAIGELLTCPFCAGVWIASGLTAGLVFAPRVTRLVSTALTAVAASDSLNLVYDRLKS